MRESIWSGRIGVRAGWAFLCWVGVSCVSAGAAWALEVQGIQTGTEPASNYDRFDNSAAWIGNPANWPGGRPTFMVGNPWSGVGRDTTAGRWATLISTDFVISASHYAPNVGDTIQFSLTNNPQGLSETRTVVAAESLQGSVAGDSGDVWIGKLSAPTLGIRTYPILSLPTPAGQNAPYGGLGIDTFGLSTIAPGTATSVRLGRNVILPGSALYSSYDYQYSNPGVGPDESQLIEGDSGAPSFFLYAGATPALLGLHWFNNAPVDTLSGDTWLTTYVKDIQTGMNQLGNPSGETVKTISPVLGDFNLDGQVTAADIPAMVAALGNLPNYESSHGMNAAYLNYIGDLNGDGQVNNADLQKLMVFLKSGGSDLTAVPEPATWVLAIAGGLMLLAWFRGYGRTWLRVI